MLRLRLITLSLISTLLVIGQANAQTPAPSTGTLSSQLVERLLGLNGDQGKLVVGRLPDNLPVNLPLPDGAKVDASISRGNMPGQGFYEIFVDANQSPDQVQAFYQQRLSAAGWQSKTNFPLIDNKGFISSVAMGITRSSFCKGSQGPLLSISAKPVPNSPTDVRLNLISNNSGFLCNSSPRPPYINGNGVPMPKLSPAPNTTVSTNGFSGGGMNTLTSSARIDTQLDGQALANYYQKLFQQAGWMRWDSKQNGSLNWSIWKFQDKEGKFWQGTLTITKVQGKTNQYSALAVVSQI